MSDIIHKIVVITGPTAAGKSDLALKLAREQNGEIVCADSMQIYRGLDIGTAKPTAAERTQVPHHCCDIIDPDANFTVTDYIAHADKAIADISARRKLPIICGGTGFYIKGLLWEQSYAGVGSDEGLRAELTAEAENRGAEYLYNKLLAADPIAASKIHANDVKRVIRALEIYTLRGAAKSSLADAAPRARYDFRLIGVDTERGELYKRINERVDKMIAAGLEDEVRELTRYKDCQSMQAIGYKQFFDYFEGVRTLGDTVALIKQKTRNYAKRQWTYLRALDGIEWIDFSTADCRAALAMTI